MEILSARIAAGKLLEEAIRHEPSARIHEASEKENPFAALSIYPVKLLLLAACIFLEKRHGQPKATEKTIFIPEALALGALSGIEKSLGDYQRGLNPTTAENN